MQQHILDAISRRTMVLDAYFENGDTSKTVVILQATPFIDITNRTINLCYYEGGVWYFSSIPFQTDQIEALERMAGWNQLTEGRIQSNIIDAINLVELNQDLINSSQPPIYRTANGLRGVYLTEKQWFSLFDTARRCNDIQKIYILERHRNENQPCATLDSWAWNDEDYGKSLWSLHKQCMTDTLFI